jgi:hypothetical protein
MRKSISTLGAILVVAACANTPTRLSDIQSCFVGRRVAVRVGGRYVFNNYYPDHGFNTTRYGDVTEGTWSIDASGVVTQVTPVETIHVKWQRTLNGCNVESEKGFAVVFDKGPAEPRQPQAVERAEH